MLNLNSILLFSENPKELADFYKKVVGKDADWAGEGYFGFSIGGANLTIGGHDKVKGKNSNPERIMFNLETEDVKGEFERIKGEGAEVVKEPYMESEADEMWIATFEDPDGNYFQLMSPWKGDK